MTRCRYRWYFGSRYFARRRLQWHPAIAKHRSGHRRWSLGGSVVRMAGRIGRRMRRRRVGGRSISLTWSGAAICTVWPPIRSCSARVQVSGCALSDGDAGAASLCGEAEAEFAGVALAASHASSGCGALRRIRRCRRLAPPRSWRASCRRFSDLIFLPVVPALSACAGRMRVVVRCSSPTYACGFSGDSGWPDGSALVGLRGLRRFAASATIFCRGRRRSDDANTQHCVLRYCGRMTPRTHRAQAA